MMFNMKTAGTGSRQRPYSYNKKRWSVDDGNIFYLAAVSMHCEGTKR